MANVQIYKDSKNYARKKDQLAVINAMDIYSMSDNELAIALMEVFKIKKVGESLHKKMYHQKNEKWKAVDASDDQGEAYKEGRDQIFLARQNQYSISGHPNFSLDNDDYSSLSNFAYILAIQNFRRCIEATKLFSDLEKVIAGFIKCDAEVKVKLKSWKLDIKGMKVFGFDDEETVVDIQLVRANRLIMQIKEIGIQKLRTYRSMKNLTSFAISAFKSKYINEGQTVELRRRINKRKSGPVVKEKTAIYAEDRQDRDEYITTLRNDFDDKKNPNNLLSEIKTIIRSNLSTEEIISELRFRVGEFNLPEAQVYKMITEYRDVEEDESHLRAA